MASEPTSAQAPPDSVALVRALLGTLQVPHLEPNFPEWGEETPARFVRGLQELISGYDQDPGEILMKRFSSDSDEMVCLREVPYYSLCEHHMLPVIGKVSLAYIPSNGIVVGLSKLARLVECFSRRFQLQERMGDQIATALFSQLRPQGVGVIVRGQHLCMRIRGARSEGEMVTSHLLGKMREDPAVRAEFMQLAGS